MLSQSPDAFTKGGIDFDPGLLNLQIKRDDSGVPLPMESQDIPHIQIEGLYPIIINITPITNLPLFLGELGSDRDKIASSF